MLGRSLWRCMGSLSCPVWIHNRWLKWLKDLSKEEMKCRVQKTEHDFNKVQTNVASVCLCSVRFLGVQRFTLFPISDRLWRTGEFFINRCPTGWRADWRILHAASAWVHSAKFLCSTGGRHAGECQPAEPAVFLCSVFSRTDGTFGETESPNLWKFKR